MLKLTKRYANALLTYAEEQGLGEIYRQALLLVVSGNKPTAQHAAGTALGVFLAEVPAEEVEPVLYAFLDLARKRMDMLKTEIISAVPLTQQQLSTLEEKLIRMFQKQLDITTAVDPSLLGGLRIIVDNTVFDESIKRKLFDMKNSVYKGVYFKQ